MICIPITANNMENALQDMTEASKVADVIELRLDYIQNPNLELLLKNRTKPIIATNRPVREGGKYTGSEEERISLLKQAIQMQVEYVDIEHDSVQYIKKFLSSPVNNKTKCIVSYHDFHNTPDTLTGIYQKLSQCKTDIIKIVTYANDITDNFKIYRLLQTFKTPIISFCMGDYGIISRILYKKFGSFLTFASLGKGKESAPGQINIHELLDVYQLRKQDSNTAIYGLIGNPVSHSISPAIHNTLFQAMNFHSVYIPFRVNNISAFMKEFKGIGIKGCSITIPYKESVIKYVDEIDPLAKKIGAVNTIVNQNGRLVGYNTDCAAAIKTLKNMFPVSSEDNHLKDKNIALLGAGGVARSIAFGLKEVGAKVTIINRNYLRAQSLAQDVGCAAEDLSRFQTDDMKWDILINATPVGMHPSVNETPINKNSLQAKVHVFDTIYNPLETKLLQDAKARGCKVANGLPMFLYQAAAQFSLWTGKIPPYELLEKIAYKKLFGGVTEVTHNKY
ncbi:MAG: shikimate dehydrogenase [Candidatus Brocadiaceae bacterium]|nr:shikimate dehydrogenase [Candidatus Brocadiaceae bacterium]